MTYSVVFAHVTSGRTVEEVLAERSAGWDEDAWDPEAPIPPMHPTPEHRRQWQQIASRITTAFGRVTVEEFPSVWTLHLCSTVGGLLLHCDGDRAEIEIPYRYPGDAALPIMTMAYQVARIVEEETGMTGFDGEVEQPTGSGDVRKAAARLGGIATWVRNNPDLTTATGRTAPVDWSNLDNLMRVDDPAVVDAGFERAEPLVGVALIGLALQHHDAVAILTRVNRALEAPQPELRRQGLVALGHTARLHRYVDSRAMSNLRRLLKDRSPVDRFEVRGEADTYAGDVWSFVDHRDLPWWFRLRQRGQGLRHLPWLRRL